MPVLQEIENDTEFAFSDSVHRRLRMRVHNVKHNEARLATRR